MPETGGMTAYMRTWIADSMMTAACNMKMQLHAVRLGIW